MSCSNWISIDFFIICEEATKYFASSFSSATQIAQKILLFMRQNVSHERVFVVQSFLCTILQQFHWLSYFSPNIFYQIYYKQNKINAIYNNRIHSDDFLPILINFLNSIGHSIIGYVTSNMFLRNLPKSVRHISRHTSKLNKTQARNVHILRTNTPEQLQDGNIIKNSTLILSSHYRRKTYDLDYISWSYSWLLPY